MGESLIDITLRDILSRSDQERCLVEPKHYTMPTQRDARKITAACKSMGVMDDTCLSDSKYRIHDWGWRGLEHLTVMSA